MANILEFVLAEEPYSIFLGLAVELDMISIKKKYQNILI